MEFSFQPPAVQGRCQAFLDATSLHRVYHHPRKQASIPFAVGAPPCCLPPRNSTGRASLPSKIHSGPTLPGRLRVSSLRSNDQPPFSLSATLLSCEEERQPKRSSLSHEGRDENGYADASVLSNKGWKGCKGVGSKMANFSWKWFPL